MDTPLIQQVALREDVEEHNEGLDVEVLIEAVSVTEFSEPVDGATLILELLEEGLL